MSLTWMPARAMESVPSTGVPACLTQAYNLAQAGQLMQASEVLTETQRDRILQMSSDLPDFGSCMTLLGSSCRRLGDLPRAVQAYEALHAKQSTPAVVFELLSLYRLQHRYEAALRCCAEEGINEQSPPALLCLYAECLLAVGRHQEGWQLYESLIASGQASAELHAAYLWQLYYHPDKTFRDLRCAYAGWVHQHVAISTGTPVFTNTPDSQRLLKIGYLSPDFRSHSVTSTFEPLLDGHDRSRYELFGYGHVAYSDTTTRRLQTKFDHFYNLWGQSPEAIAQQIRADGIDVLTGLSSHSSSVTMQVLARKSAPVQVDFGSLSTTALRQVDLRISDALQDEPTSQAHYVETLVTINGGFIPYRPPENAPPVQSLPALSNGAVTFGAFGNHLKINPEVVACWSAVLRQLAQSRLLMKCAAGEDPAVRRYLLRLFAQQGISAERIQICGWLPKVTHWDLYNQVDIALDTFPFNGGLTTLEGFWMGVPTVTLAGDSFASRTGLALLTHVGLTDLIGTSVPDMAGRAVALARQLETLVYLRKHLRSMVQASPLCDYPRMVHGVERVYRQRWSQWCREQVEEVTEW